MRSFSMHIFEYRMDKLCAPTTSRLCDLEQVHKGLLCLMGFKMGLMLTAISEAIMTIYKSNYRDCVQVADLPLECPQ